MAPKVSEEHRDSKRALIIEAAKRVFIRQGYERTTMKDVVEEAGLSRGGVYLYFSSTEEMMLAIIDEADKLNFRDFTLLYEQYGSLWKALEQLFELNTQGIEQLAQTIVPVFIEFHILSWRNGKHAQYTAERYERSLQYVVSLLNKGVEQGEFRPIVPVTAIAQMFISFHDGMFIGVLQLGMKKSGALEQIDALKRSIRYLLQVQNEERG
ncbi:TetR family transcriptional regulator [Paenibacillus sp. GCM10027626]|uniref:TetR family transcriptional regulator n=1 Tax=Paenibacillus sp. GCM10027626 TaxID=3273411 RepID=UPI00362FBEE7